MRVEGEFLRFFGKVDMVACHSIDIFSWVEKIDCHPLGGICGEGKGVVGVGVGPPSHPISNWGWVTFDGLTMFIGVHFGGTCELPLVIDPSVYGIKR